MSTTKKTTAEMVAEEKAIEAERLARDNAIAQRAGAELAATLEAQRAEAERGKVSLADIRRQQLERELKVEARQQYLAAGGDEAAFEARWETLKTTLIEQRVAERLSAARQRHARVVAGMF